MRAVSEKLGKIKTFLQQDLWTTDVNRLPWVQMRLLRYVRLFAAVTQGFLADRCMLRASALTYATLLSIVPLLALMFAVLKGFGVQNVLEPLILEKLALGAEDIVSQIISYIDNTNVTRLGIVGMTALLLTVLALLSNIEKSFNHIWGVNETRPLLRRFSDYFSVVTIGPVFVLAAISMTSSLASNQLVTHLQSNTYFGPLILLLFKSIPFVGMWITFTALYIFMPNTRVRYPAALAGGIFGGTLWQLAQWWYVHFQVGVGKYNAIYGTMAALPIFMIWIYVSWLIVLLGVEVTFAWQNLRLVSSDIRGSEVNQRSRERVALTLMLTIAEQFYGGKNRWDSGQLAEYLDLPPRLTHDLLQQMVQLGLLAEVQAGRKNNCSYQPGRALAGLTVYELLQILRGDGIDYCRLRETPEWELVSGLEEALAKANREALAEMTLQGLLERLMLKRNEGDPQDSSGEKVLRENLPSSSSA